MNPAVIALASSVSWGSSDFLGGLTARRISPYQAVGIAHSFSLVCLLAAAYLFHVPGASHGTVLFGLVAGFFGGSGLIVFYRALSLGNMGLTAAIGGVLSAAVPVLFSLFTEGLPGLHQLVGFCLAIVAIWIIASGTAGSAGEHSSVHAGPYRLWQGVVAGSCFGIYFVLLKQAVTRMGHAEAPLSILGGVLWSITFSRVSSTLLAMVACVWMGLRKPSRPEGSTRLLQAGTLLLAAAAGVLDMGGNLLYTLAARLGRMDVAAVLSSLYPAVTILLAAWVLRERSSRRQSFGMALALAAVGLISL